MLTDRLTARVLGTVLLFLSFVIDLSCIVFARPELRGRASFLAVVIVPSLPLFLGGALLLRKASRLPDPEEDERR
jgi:hypothetical protein